ncbi:unnamed protein product [Ectocarpus sp. CCAP 1310/34]|nr:unnamed protein product [Ectocarpus sp. CCAP 1310/34]
MTAAGETAGFKGSSTNPEGVVASAATTTADASCAPGAATSAEASAGPQQRKARGLSTRESRGRGWLDLIERLELEHRGGTPLVASSSEASVSGDDENENDSEAGDSSDGTTVTGGGGGGGGGGGRSGSGSDAAAGVGKGKPKTKKRTRKHSFDYEDDFIDDTLLVEAYYAKEASSKVKTVHTGFFANQGAVATVDSDDGGERSSGGAGDAGGADSEVIVRPKKKKVQNANTKRAANVCLLETSHPGSGAPAAAAAATAAAATAVPTATTGVGATATSQISAALPGGAGAVDAGAGVGSSGGGSSGDTPVTPTAVPADWSPELEAATVRFEQDSKAWVDSGRPAGDGAQVVLEAMRTLDALVRRSSLDAHSKDPYLGRLSAVYGQPQAAVKTVLATLKDRDDTKEAARLHQEYRSLRANFETNVDQSVELQRANGSPLAPPYVWSDPVRLCLHDMLRACEAWIAKEHGGRLTRKAIEGMKNIFDELSQRWPAELEVTADQIKKMYTNEKRRMKTKAQREAAAEAAPSGTATSAGGRASPPPGSAMSPPPTPTATASSAAAAGAVGAAAQRQQQTPTPAPTAPPSPAMPVASSRSPVASEAVAAATSTAVVGAVPDGGGGGGGGSGPTLVTIAPTMPAEPPRGVRFDAPPAFDHRAFNEDVAEEEPPVTVW